MRDLRHERTWICTHNFIYSLSKQDQQLACTNIWHGQTSGMDKHLAWTNIWHGPTSGMDKHLAWTNATLMSTLGECVTQPEKKCILVLKTKRQRKSSSNNIIFFFFVTKTTAFFYSATKYIDKYCDLWSARQAYESITGRTTIYHNICVCNDQNKGGIRVIASKTAKYEPSWTLVKCRTNVLPCRREKHQIPWNASSPVHKGH